MSLRHLSGSRRGTESLSTDPLLQEAHKVRWRQVQRDARNAGKVRLQQVSRGLTPTDSCATNFVMEAAVFLSSAVSVGPEDAGGGVVAFISARDDVSHENVSRDSKSSNRTDTGKQVQARSCLRTELSGLLVL